MNIAERVLATAVLKVLGDLVIAEKNAERDQVAAILAPGDRLTPRLPDGTAVPGARVRVDPGKVSLNVVDERALLAWLAKHHPTEVETVQRARPAWLEKIRSTVRIDGPVPDANGEPIPGLDAKIGDPYTVVTADDDAAAALIDAWRAGALPGLPGLPALPGPAEPNEPGRG